MMVIDNKYELGEIVYLTTDTEQMPRVVTGLKICPAGLISYMLSCGTANSEHYDFEISAEQNTVAKL